jgi:hypothetical protein
MFSTPHAQFYLQLRERIKDTIKHLVLCST